MSGSGADRSVAGRVALVTGATGDMGRVIATELAARGATVVLVARDPAKGAALQRDIARTTGRTDAVPLTADLADLSDVRRLAAAVHGRFDRVDVLVNNAGVHADRRRTGADGIELHLTVNHLAPFLLTRLLLPALRSGAQARVVNVASQAMADARLVPFGPRRPVTLDPDDLQSERDFAPMLAYGRSKLAMVMTGYVLAERLAGTGVTVNALHPGLVATAIAADVAPRWARPLLGVVRPFLRTPQQGAQGALHLATAPELAGVTGRYIVDGVERPTPPVSYDPELRRRVWEASSRLVGLPDDALDTADHRRR